MMPDTAANSKVFFHDSAVVDEGSVVGCGTRIWHFCHVMAGARIGDDCVLGQGVFVASGAIVGDRVRIQNHVSVYDGVVIEDDVFLGPSCVLTNVSYPRAGVSRRDAYETTRLARGCTVGANATVVCGTTIGAYATVGAGAVVTRDVPPQALVLGVPARQAGWVCRCGEVLIEEVDSFRCPRTAARYRRKGCGLLPLD